MSLAERQKRHNRQILAWERKLERDARRQRQREIDAWCSWLARTFRGLFSLVVLVLVLAHAMIADRLGC